MKKEIIKLLSKKFKIQKSELKKPILIDFWADWCNPCKMISLILEEIKKEYSKKIFVLKINIDNNKEIAEKYNIRSIPTLIILNKMNIIDTHIGVLSKKELRDFIDKNIK